MEEIKSYIGYYFHELIYRGNNVFTLMIKKDIQDDLPLYAINFIDCINLNDDGICKGVFYNYDDSILGMASLFIIQKNGLNKDDFRQIFIQADCGGKKRELVALCKDIVGSKNIHLYNPTSEENW